MTLLKKGNAMMEKATVYGLGPIKLMRAIVQGIPAEVEIDVFGIEGKTALTIATVQRLGPDKNSKLRIKGSFISDKRLVHFVGDYSPTDHRAVVNLL